jgi:uncharacterized protein YciI
MLRSGATRCRLAIDTLNQRRRGGATMPYVILTEDRPDGGDLRAKLRPEHLDYLTKHAARLLAAGARTEDDGSGGNGGVIILDTDDRAEAEAFIQNDPFTKGGLFSSVVVQRWRKAFFDGKRLV